jgi:hypothetical protein
MAFRPADRFTLALGTAPDRPAQDGCGGCRLFGSELFIALPVHITLRAMILLSGADFLARGRKGLMFGRKFP